MNPQFDPKVIETLKAARSQVAQAGKSRSEDEQKDAAAPSVDVAQKSSKGSVEILVAGQTQLAARNNFAPLEAHTKSVTDTAGVLPLTGFAEEFVQKLTAIEQEMATVDEEIAKMEKIWLNLTEKKKQLETKKNELIKVKDKLKELDKEMSDVLKSQSFDKLRIDPEQRRMGQ